MSALDAPLASSRRHARALAKRRRTARLEVLLVLAALAGVTSHLAAFRAASADAYVYFGTSDATIARANLDGSHVNTHFIANAPSDAIALDGAHIYWVWATVDSQGNFTGSGVGRANLDGSNANQNFIPGLPLPYYTGETSIAADSAHIYFTWNGKQIGRANLDGSGVDWSFIADPTWADGTTTGPASVAVQGQYLYWYAGNRIGRANLDGSGVNEGFITGTGGLPTYSLAADGGHLYWNLAAENGAGSVARVNLDGSGMNKGFISQLSSPFRLAVDTSHIYWVSSTAIDRANVDGSGATGLYQADTGLRGPDWISHVKPIDIAVDGLGPSGGAPTKAKHTHKGAGCRVSKRGHAPKHGGCPRHKKRHR